VLKKAFPAFFNYGLRETNSRKPLKLLELKIGRFGGTSIYRSRSVLFQHASGLERKGDPEPMKRWIIKQLTEIFYPPAVSQSADNPYPEP